MPSPRTKPSLTSLVAFFLIVMIYAASYFMVVRIEHSVTTGNAGAEYPAFVEPVSIVFRPMESIDRRIRTDLWAAEPVEYWWP